MFIFYYRSYARAKLSQRFCNDINWLKLQSTQSQKYYLYASSQLNRSKTDFGRRDGNTKQICGLHRSQHKLAERLPGNENESSTVAGIKVRLPVTAAAVTASSFSQMPPNPKPKKKVRNFVFAKFFRFVQGYHKILENNFPGAMHVYRVFVVGFKVFSV